MTTLSIIGGGILLLILVFIGIYNMLVVRKNRIDEAWSDIDVQLKRRYDLIPNVVESVKGYAGHERSVLENVTKARTQALGAHSPEEHARAENMLSGTLKTLFAVAESYPDLKANTNFIELQHELADTENKIQAARRFYNANVRDYNTMLGTFPSNTVAGMFSFVKKEFFEIGEEQAREPVKVTF